MSSAGVCILVHIWCSWVGGAETGRLVIVYVGTGGVCTMKALIDAAKKTEEKRVHIYNEEPSSSELGGRWTFEADLTDELFS